MKIEKQDKVALGDLAEGDEFRFNDIGHTHRVVSVSPPVTGVVHYADDGDPGVYYADAGTRVYAEWEGEPVLASGLAVAVSHRERGVRHVGTPAPAREGGVLMCALADLGVYGMVARREDSKWYVVLYGDDGSGEGRGEGFVDATDAAVHDLLMGRGQTTRDFAIAWEENVG